MHADVSAVARMRYGGQDRGRMEGEATGSQGRCPWLMNSTPLGSGAGIANQTRLTCISKGRGWPLEKGHLHVVDGKTEI